MGSILRHYPSHPLTKGVLFLFITLVLFRIFLSPAFLLQSNPSPSSQAEEPTKIESSDESPIRRCDYADGRWVPDPRAPPYTGTSCATIKPGQNCQAHGRPDAGYLHWRWQPKSCHLPRFDPAAFLHLISNKHLAFVGDSMARNQLESLLCLLAPNSPAKLEEDGKLRRWVFRSHNATVSLFWSPFLVEGVEKSPSVAVGHNKLYLDALDKLWAAELEAFDVAVFSVGHWFLHPAVFFEGGDAVGCHHCPDLNHTEVGIFSAFRKAVRAALTEVKAGGERYAVVATFSPAHFDGEWDKAGACGRKEPYREGEKEMEYMDGEMRRIEMEEVEAAAGGGGVMIEALDVTKMAMMRPDGHPGPYMNPNPFAGGPKERVQNDCVHWCLPGPIDAWNEILLEMMRRWKDEKRR